jgi:hypothetical protein
MNSAEMVARERNRWGDNHPTAVLTSAAVSAIRAEYASGTASYASLARAHGVGVMTIANVITRVTWARVP